MNEPSDPISTILRELRADISERQHGTVLDYTQLQDRISRLNKAVKDYDIATIGHGAMIGDFEERLRRVEQHLNLPPMKAALAGLPEIVRASGRNGR